MKENETNYGNFAEPRAPFSSRRSEDVVLSALKRCEELESELRDAFCLIGKLNTKIRELEDLIEILRGEK